MARFFGASVQMDVYLLASSIPTFVSGTVAAVLSYTIVPDLVHYRAKGYQYRQYGGMLHSVILIFSILVCGIGMLFAKNIIVMINPALVADLVAVATEIARVCWFAGILSITAIYLGNVLNVAGIFIVSAVANSLPYIAMIISTLCLGKALGPLAVVIGMLVGYLAAVLVLMRYAANTIRLFAWCKSMQGDMLSYCRRVPVFLMAMLCFTVYQSIDAFWGTRLGEGNLAVLGYCQRILIAIGTLVITGPSAVLMPKFTESYAADATDLFLTIAEKVLRLVLVVGSLCALIVSLLAHPIVKLLFQRGAFNTDATNKVATLLPYMLSGMVAMLLVIMLMRMLFAMRTTIGPAAIGLACTASYFVFSGLLSPIFDLTGIGIAYICSWGIGLVMAMRFVWQKQIGRLLHRGNAIFMCKLLANLCLVAILIRAIQFYTAGMMQNHDSVLFQTLATCGTSLLAVMLFFLCSIKLFHLEDVAGLFAQLISYLPLRQKT